MEHAVENVDVIEILGRRFILIGTAHISRKSAELVRQVITEHRPDTICVELDEGRFHSLTDPTRWQKTDLFEVIKSGRGYLLMAQLALSAFQKRLAEQFDIRPGEEMLTAISCANDSGARIELVDREVKITLKRAWAKASLWSMLKTVTSLLFSVFNSATVSEREIEELKQGDALSAMMAEFSAHLPGLKEALIDERDLYMACKIADAPGQTVVAVLGAGHIPGIKAVFGTPIDILPLEELPPGRLGAKIFTWSIPAVFLVMLVWGFFRSGFQTSLAMVKVWILSTSIPSAIGAALALAHPLTILSAFVSAPITTIHPAIAVGWVAGLVEALIRKPTVRDLENISVDVQSMRGIWTNRATRILLIMALANLGGALGTFIGIGTVASKL